MKFCFAMRTVLSLFTLLPLRLSFSMTLFVLVKYMYFSADNSVVLYSVTHILVVLAYLHGFRLVEFQ